MTVHVDVLGNYLNVGDTIYYAKGNGLRKGVIEALTPKMVRTVRGTLIYPSDCIIPGRMPV